MWGFIFWHIAPLSCLSILKFTTKSSEQHFQPIGGRAGEGGEGKEEKEEGEQDMEHFLRISLPNNAFKYICFFVIIK